MVPLSPGTPSSQTHTQFSAIKFSFLLRKNKTPRLTGTEGKPPPTAPSALLTLSGWCPTGRRVLPTTWSTVPQQQVQTSWNKHWKEPPELKGVSSCPSAGHAETLGGWLVIPVVNGLKDDLKKLVVFLLPNGLTTAVCSDLLWLKSL